MASPEAKMTKPIRQRLSEVLFTSGANWDGRPFCQDAYDEINRLQALVLEREGMLAKAAIEISDLQRAVEPPAEPMPFKEWAADMRTQSMQSTLQAYKAKLQKLEYELACRPESSENRNGE